MNPSAAARDLVGRCVVEGEEADETFYLDLFGNSSNSLVTKSRGVGTILNDD